MRIKHKDKIKLARKMRTQEELVNRVPIFQTKAWDARRARLAKKQKLSTVSA